MDPAASGIPATNAAGILARIQRAAEGMDRLKGLRSAHEERVIRRELRRSATEMSDYDRRLRDGEAAALREDAELDSWVVEEAEFMLRSGWTVAQLEEFGFSAAALETAARRARRN